MRRKIGVNLIVLFLALALIFPLVSAGTPAVNGNITVITPTNSAVISGTFSLNCSMQIASYEDQNWTESFFYAKSASTANSSWTLIAREINDSAGAVYNAFNETFSTKVLEDANDYIFNCTIFNGTTRITNVRTGITIDNTLPTAPTSLSPTSDSDGTVDFSASVYGNQTTSCVLYFPGINPGISSYTMTHSGNTCTKSSLSMPEGSYQYYVVASDESNTSTSSTEILKIDIKTSAGKTAALLSQPGITSKGGATLSVVSGLSTEVIGLPLGLWIGLIIIALIVWFVVKRK